MKWLFDAHPFARGGSVTICAIGLMFIIQASLLAIWPSSGKATTIRALEITFLYFFGIGDEWLSFVMVASAVLAFMGTLFRLGHLRLAIFVPQHVLLFFMMLGAVAASWQGAYLDGTVMPRPHIVSDQMAIVTLFVIYSSAIVRRARDSNG
jgi:hypothetical protein